MSTERNSAESDEASPKREAEPPAASLLDRAAAAWPQWDTLVYRLFVSLVVAYAAIAFYSYMKLQTGGVWSAPLDDVFIHFDYARATARGYPFEWSEGNGYSSGNTSLLYPFVLALGYLAGFRELYLMEWAAYVACASVIVFLVASGRLFEPLGRWAKYVAPPVVLSLGALNWTLWSGMENAFHLALWGALLMATLALAAPEAKPTATKWLALLAGLLGALLVATRPESVVCVAAFGVYGALAIRKRQGARAAMWTLVRIGLPGALLVVGQAFANHALTGEWSANGAIAKLALNNPYMSSADKWDQYTFLLGYVILRNTQHHFSAALPWGWLVPAVALVPLSARKLRPVAILLWVQIIGWLALVSLNGQVRWQNERYTMAAVAWLLLLAAMGLGVIVEGALSARSGRVEKALRLAGALAIVAIYWVNQAPNMRDQIWFFGRASRNIRDQHLVAGTFLAKLAPRRVLVGDAGALIYASDRPGLDLIGLGGYHDYPFARATVHGLGASLELIEHMPREERPDAMAIYPSWWGDLPTIFGRRIIGVPVAGNVICGGPEKVLYRADWSPMDRSGSPRTLWSGERVVDELDVADLLSERAHDYVFPHPSMGFVSYRVLSDPADSKRDLFDAGRQIPGGQTETARMRAGSAPSRLVVRTAAAHGATIEVGVNGEVIGSVVVARSDGWEEVSVDLPPRLSGLFDLTLRPTDGEWIDHHVWVVEKPQEALAAGPHR